MTAELTISPAPQRERSARVSAEVGFCEVLSELMGGGPVDVEGHFFDELGADSLVMAHFCSRVRKRTDLPSVSMKDVYRHPTIAALAGALVDEIDELVVKAYPVLAGAGMPFLSGGGFSVRDLRRVSTVSFDSGHMVTEYVRA